MSRPALIFCESLDGHRQSYAAVLARIMHEAGRDVWVAFNERTSSSRTAILDLAQETGLLRCLPYRVGAGAPLTETLIASERKVGAELTVIPAGDEVCPRLHDVAILGDPGVRRIPIFIAFTHLYGPSTIQGTPLFRWRRWAKAFWTQERYLRKTMWKDVGATACLTTQPRSFALPRSSKWTLVPEIYRAWGFEQGETPESARFIERMRDFAAANRGCDILLYYGMYQSRRGYDELLRLARDDERYAVLFFGRWGNEEDRRQLAQASGALADAGRLLEMEVPFGPETPALDEAFRLCRVMPLPYDRHYNMSGTLIQAASYGIPSLVPDIGVMAETVRKLRVGWTFRHGSYAAFRDGMTEALASDLSAFREPNRMFAEEHSWEAVRIGYSHALAP